MKWWKMFLGKKESSVVNCSRESHQVNLSLEKPIPPLFETNCKHDNVKFFAATTVQAVECSQNGIVGVNARCQDCGKSWVGDVVAGISKSISQN